MGLHNIEKKSLGYIMLKIWAKFWHNKIYYRNFTLLGTENIPFDKPLIFTPNHQNALMDALALLFSIKKQLVFLARADIFKKPSIARILYFLKILPIYRVKDGFDTVKKNKDIILKTVDIITSGNAMVILPEGNHSGIRRLRPLKKGFARMAFQAEEANDFLLDVHIVPVGLDYDDYQKFRSSLIVKFGEPIAVKEYNKLYKETPSIAINKITQRLSEHLKPLIVNIESEEYYEFYNELRDIYRSRMAQHLNVDVKDERNRVYIDQQLIDRVTSFANQNPDTLNKYQQTINKFVKLRDQFGFTNSIIDQKGINFFNLIGSSISLLATLPLFLYGVVNNFLSIWFPVKLSKKFEDPQFKSSIRYVISLLSFPVFYIIQSIAVLIIFADWKIGLVYFISLPLSASFAWCWYNTISTIRAGWNYRKILMSKDNNFNEMQKLYDEIIIFGDRIMSENKI